MVERRLTKEVLERIDVSGLKIGDAAVSSVAKRAI